MCACLKSISFNVWVFWFQLICSIQNQERYLRFWFQTNKIRKNRPDSKILWLYSLELQNKMSPIKMMQKTHMILHTLMTSQQLLWDLSDRDFLSVTFTLYSSNATETKGLINWLRLHCIIIKTWKRNKLTTTTIHKTGTMNSDSTKQQLRERPGTW